MPTREGALVSWRPISKLALSMVLSVAVVVVIFPIGAYEYCIGRVDPMPAKPSAVVSAEETRAVWALNERCLPENCSSITPYWIYRWLMFAVVNDYVHPMDLDQPYRDVSAMASRIAIDHMRRIEFRPKGMLWWHVTHAFLGIWVQRNWTDSEIATKYLSLDD